MVHRAKSGAPRAARSATMLWAIAGLIRREKGTEGYRASGNHPAIPRDLLLSGVTRHGRPQLTAT